MLTFTSALVFDRIKVNQQAKYLHIQSFHSTRNSADAEIEDAPSREYACKASSDIVVTFTLGLQQGQRRLVLAPANYLTSEVSTTDQQSHVTYIGHTVRRVLRDRPHIKGRSRKHVNGQVKKNVDGRAV